jgi:hypothetical protein
MLDQFATNDKSVVSFHTHETTQQSKQQLGKGQPYQGQEHASRSKKMEAFFDSKGFI